MQDQHCYPNNFSYFSKICQTRYFCKEAENIKFWSNIRKLFDNYQDAYMKYDNLADNMVSCSGFNKAALILWNIRIFIRSSWKLNRFSLYLCKVVKLLVSAGNFSVIKQYHKRIAYFAFNLLELVLLNSTFLWPCKCQVRFVLL